MNSIVEINNYDENDFSLLYANSFFNNKRNTAKSIITNLTKNISKENIFIAKHGNTHCLFGFKNIDKSSNNAQCWIAQPYNNKNLEIIFERVISFLLYEGFYIRKFHKITFQINSGDVNLLPVLEKNKFLLEGKLKENTIFNEKYTDTLIYSILFNEFELYSTAFIPFLSGSLIIKSTNNAVFEISINKNREETINKFYQLQSSYECDQNNKTSPNEDELIISSDIDVTNNSEIIIYKNAYPYLFTSSLQIDEYIKGNRSKFDLMYEYFSATNFQKNVWEATLTIPFGQTKTYEEISALVNPEEELSKIRFLSRAVGTALSRNPIMIAIPCHRVIGKDGKLKGFAGGLDVKDYLLNHEMLRLL